MISCVIIQYHMIYTITEKDYNKLKYQQIGIGLSDKHLNKVDRLASSKCMSRSQFLRTLISNALDRIDDSSSLDYRIMKLEQTLRELTYEKSLREDNTNA